MKGRGPKSPFSAAFSVAARCRVEWAGSPVTRKLGHITPLSVRWHWRLPIQTAAALPKAPPAAGAAA